LVFNTDIFDRDLTPVLWPLVGGLEVELALNSNASALPQCWGSSGRADQTVENITTAGVECPRGHFFDIASAGTYGIAIAVTK
jgi:hypothetical protein